MRKNQKFLIFFLIFLISGNTIAILNEWNDLSVTDNIIINNSTLIVSSGVDWAPHIKKSVRNGPISVCIGDANNDGQNDIVTVNSKDNTTSIFL